MTRHLGLSDPRWSWAPALVVLGVLAVLGLGVLLERRKVRRSTGLLLAHTSRVRSLPRYRALVTRRRSAALLSTSAALLVVAGTALVLARPQSEAVEQRAPRGRDLMLCLDASASMDAEDVAVVQEMRGIVARLHGDRVGMVIWSGAAVQVFPLTDDYEFVDAQLDRAAAAFAGHADGYYAGVDLAVDRSSVIGDGIVSCVNRFDDSSSDRTRAVILASDNDPRGTPAYSLDDAATYAVDHDVIVYGIGAASLDDPGRADARQAMADAVSRTGGVFEILDPSGGDSQIVDRIADLEKARAAEPPRRVFRDTPYAGMALATLGVGCLALSWAMAGWRRRRGSRPRVAT